MKNSTLILIISFVLLESCSCIPTSTEVNGKYQLEAVLDQQGTKQHYQDSLIYVSFDLEMISDVNKTVENYSSNGQKYIWTMTENPDQCENTARKRIFVTYNDGSKRRIIRDASDPMKVRLEMSEVYQGDEVPEFPVYYYVVVTQ